MHNPNETCPLCKADLRGTPIPQHLIAKGYYSPNATHYLRVIALYDQDRDCTVAYRCPECGGQWDREFK